MMRRGVAEMRMSFNHWLGFTLASMVLLLVATFVTLATLNATAVGLLAAAARRTMARLSRQPPARAARGEPHRRLAADRRGDAGGGWTAVVDGAG